MPFVHSQNYADYGRPLPRPLHEPHTQPLEPLKVDAIFIFNDPRDWALDTQLILDLLLSHKGILGTVSPNNNNPSLPNCGYQQDGQPPLYFSNPDLHWAAKYHLPRLGQGGFREAFEGVWNAVTGGEKNGVTLQKTMFGKPYKGTYEFAERRLVDHHTFLASSTTSDPPPTLKDVYMVGGMYGPNVPDLRQPHTLKSSYRLMSIQITRLVISLAQTNTPASAAVNGVPFLCAAASFLAANPNICPK